MEEKNLGRVAVVHKGNFNPENQPYNRLDEIYGNNGTISGSFRSKIEDNSEPLSNSLAWGLVSKDGDKGDKGEGASPFYLQSSPAIETYADLTSLAETLSGADVNKAWLNKADGLVYVWDGTAFPADGEGLDLGSDNDPQGLVNYFNRNLANEAVVSILADTITQTAEGVSKAYSFSSDFAANTFSEKVCNIWVDGKVVRGTGTVSIAVSVMAAGVQVHYENVILSTDELGKFKLTTVGLGSYDQIVLYPTTTGNAQLFVQDIYFGTGELTEFSYRLGDREIDILRGVTPNNRTNFTTDPLAYGDYWTLEDDGSISNSQIGYFPSFVVTDLEAIKREGNAYISLLIKNLGPNSIGISYRLNTASAPGAWSGGDYFKNVGDFWKEYVKEIAIGADIVSIEFAFHKPTADVTFIKNMVVSENKYRQGTGAVIDTFTKEITPIFNRLDGRAAAMPDGSFVYGKVGKSITIPTGIPYNLPLDQYINVEDYAGNRAFLLVKGSEAGGVTSYSISFTDALYSPVGAVNDLIAFNKCESFVIPANAFYMSIVNLRNNTHQSAFENIILSEKFITSDAVLGKNSLEKTLENVVVKNVFPFSKLSPAEDDFGANTQEVSQDGNGDFVLKIKQGDKVVYRFDLNEENRIANSFVNFKVNQPQKASLKVTISGYAVGGFVETSAASTFVLSSIDSWDDFQFPFSLENLYYMRILFENLGTSDIEIKNVSVTNREILPTTKLSSNRAIEGAFYQVDSMLDAMKIGVDNEFRISNVHAVKNVPIPLGMKDFRILENSRVPTVTDMQDVQYIDTKGLTLQLIDQQNNIWLAGDIATYVIPLTTFQTLLSAPILMPIGTVLADGTTVSTRAEYFVELNISTIATYKVLDHGALGIRQMGNGEVCIWTYAGMITSSANRTAFNAPIVLDLKGYFINAWLFDAVENVVVIGGYFAAGYDGSGTSRGKGNLWVSYDSGQTFSLIFNTEATSLPIGNGFHIHGACYDKYYDRVWMVVGDSDADTTPGKVYYCDNYKDATPTWKILPFNGASMNANLEQYCTVYADESFLLFGSDTNPSTLNRMARSADKNKNVIRETAVYINPALTHVPCAMNRYKPGLPIAILNGVQNLPLTSRASIIVSDNCNNFYEVWEDYLPSAPRTDTFNTIFYLEDHSIYTFKQDVRFSGGITMVRGKLGDWN